MHNYYKKLKILDLKYQSKNLIRWALGHRLIKTYDHLGFEEIPCVYSDRYGSYKEFFPAGNLIQFKCYTPSIERNNGRQQHWLEVFKR